jgi:hypothetical protein
VGSPAELEDFDPDIVEIAKIVVAYGGTVERTRDAEKA